MSCLSLKRKLSEQVIEISVGVIELLESNKEALGAGYRDVGESY